jgi:hypothetical protein
MAGGSRNRVRQHLENESDSSAPLLSRYAEQAEEAIQEYPLGVTLAALAAGLSVGAMIGCALASPRGLRQPAVAENLGRRILDSIAEYVPASIQQQFRG